MKSSAIIGLRSKPYLPKRTCEKKLELHLSFLYTRTANPLAIGFWLWAGAPQFAGATRKNRAPRRGAVDVLTLVGARAGLSSHSNASKAVYLLLLPRDEASRQPNGEGGLFR